MLSLAAYTGVKAWSSIQQIQAQGIIGQAFNQEAYEAATTQLTLAVVLILVGFVLAISAAAYHVSGKLEEIS